MPSIATSFDTVSARSSRNSAPAALAGPAGGANDYRTDPRALSSSDDTAEDYPSEEPEAPWQSGATAPSMAQPANQGMGQMQQFSQRAAHSQGVPAPVGAAEADEAATEGAALTEDVVDAGAATGAPRGGAVPIEIAGAAPNPRAHVMNPVIADQLPPLISKILG